MSCELYNYTNVIILGFLSGIFMYYITVIQNEIKTIQNSRKEMQKEITNIIDDNYVKCNTDILIQIASHNRIIDDKIKKIENLVREENYKLSLENNDKYKALRSTLLEWRKLA
jgi:hypothetical protein